MKRKVIIVILFLLIIINHFYNLTNKEKDVYLYDHSINLDQTDNKALMHRNEKLVQEITAQDDNFNKIKIYLDPIDNSYKGVDYTTINVQLTLKDENKKEIEKYKYEKTFLTDDGAMEFKFPTIKKSKNKKYYLYIETYREQNILLKIAKREKEDSKLYINNKLSDYSLMYKTQYKLTNTNNLGYIISFILIAIFIITYIYLDKNKQKLKIEKQYLIVAILIGSLMLFLSPLFVGQDEMSHYARVYELARGKMTSDIIEGWPQQEVENNAFNVNFNNYNDVLPRLYDAMEESDTRLYNMEFTSVYSPLSYLFATLGAILAKFLMLSPFLWPYFARFFQMIFCITCLYHAIKIIPFGKKTLFAVALLPTAIEATSLLSADANLVACSILLIAKIFEITYQKKEMNKKDIAVLFITTLMIAISKLVYFPMCLLLLLIPYKLKEDRKELLKQIAKIILIALLITFLWNIHAVKRLTEGQGVNAIHYVQNFIKNPLSFIQVTFYSFYNQIGNFISDLFGGKNKWYANTINDSTIFPVIFLITYIGFMVKERNPLSKKEKEIIGGSLFLTYILISTSLLITCTPFNYKEIIGIQGRYFVSFLLPLAFIFQDNKKKEKTSINVATLITMIYLAYFLNLITNYI